MATKITITSYVNSLLGRPVSLSLPDQMIMAGMEDIVNKFTMVNPAMLSKMSASTNIASASTTIHNPDGELKVFRGRRPCIRISGLEELPSDYSLKRPDRLTTYFYVTGNTLNITPFYTGTPYRYEGLAYNVSNGSLTWPDMLTYPLALYCAIDVLFKDFSTEIDNIITAASTTLSMSLSYTNALTRLSRDDVELAKAELEKLSTEINEYAVKSNQQAVVAQNIKSRVDHAMSLLLRMNTLKQRYNEYFGMVEKSGGKSEDR